MTDSILPKRYASALFELAQQKNVIEAIYKEITSLNELLRISEEFKEFVFNPEISIDNRKEILETVFGAKLSKLAFNFMRLLIEKRRLNILEEICDAFENLYMDHKGLIKVDIESARDMPARQIDSIKEQLQNKFQKNIDYNLNVDPELIAGFTIRVGDMIHDYSVRNQLEKFRNRIKQS